MTFTFYNLVSFVWSIVLSHTCNLIFDQDVYHKLLILDFDTTFQISAASPTREVHFVSDLESYDCDIHREELDEGQINCYTR